MSPLDHRGRSTIVGRDEDRASIAALLAVARSVTLTGPGGIGKTTLARSFLAAGAAPEPGWCIDLAAVERLEDVPLALAAAMRLVVTEADDAISVIVGFLRPRRVLFVLDNVEHLRGIGSVVAQLLMAAPDIRVLATSRAPLADQPGLEFPVRGLALPTGGTVEEIKASPAGDLFLRVARQVGAPDELDDDAASDLAALIRRLNGMPLAIEVAAGRSRAAAPRELLDRLDDPAIVATDAPGADAMEASLDRVLAMTFDHLVGPVRRLLAALATCPGTFGLELAAALGPDVAVIPAMDTLVAAGLVHREADVDGESRFRLLEAIRVRAGRELTPGDRAVALERHARATAEIVAQLRVDRLPDERRAVARFIADDDTIAAAVAWAAREDASLGLRILDAFDRRAQGGVALGRSVRWCREMLASAPADDPLRRSVTRSLFRLTTRYAGPLAALAMERELLSDVELAPRAVQRETYLHLRSVHLALGDVEGVTRCTGMAVATADDPDDAAALRLDAEAMRAWTGARDALRSAELYRQSAAAAARAGRTANQGIGLCRAALAELRADRPAVAAALARDAIDLCPPALGRAHAGTIAALALAATGATDAARRILADAWLDVAHEARIDRIEVLEAAVALLAAEDRHEAALAALAIADRERPTTGWARDPHVAHLLGTWRQRSIRSLGPRRAALAAADAVATSVEDLMGEVLAAPAAAPSNDGLGAVEHLTPREVEVLALVAQGRSDIEIAAALVISPRTASVHVANIKGKLGLDSRLQVALHARAIGIPSNGSEAAAG